MDASELRLELLCCTSTILDEVAEGQRQADIATTYALAMRSEAAGCDSPDWPAINRAILGRWKPSGLERIKKRAHKLLAAGIGLGLGATSGATPPAVSGPGE